jgi:hypothetical protein
MKILRRPAACATTANDILRVDSRREYLPSLDGQISDFMSSPIAKNIPLSPSGKSVLSARAIPFRKEGVGHRHELTGCGGRDGVGRETRSQGDFS